jgi:hypothetical protein
MTIVLWLRLILTAVALIAICGLIVLCPNLPQFPDLRCEIEQWREKRAIKKRDAAAAKRHADMIRWGLMCYPKEARRIPNSRLDPARRTGQFSIPERMRDMKGVTR